MAFQQSMQLHKTVTIICALLLSAFMVGLQAGMLLPLLAVLLTNAGYGDGVVGLNAALTGLGVVTMALFADKVIARWGATRSIIIGILLAAFVQCLVLVTNSLLIWFAIRFIVGLAIAPGWIASETWIVKAAPPQHRSKITALYGMCILGGFAAGPLLLTLVGTGGATPFIWIVGLSAIACVPIWLVRGDKNGGKSEADPESANHSNPLIGLRLLGIGLIAVMFVSGVVENATFSLLTNFGLGQGLTESASIQLVSWFMVGNLLLMLPLGIVADRVGVGRVLIFCGTLGTSLALSLLIFGAGNESKWLFVLGLVAFGGTIGSLYALSLSRAGNLYSDHRLLQANASIVLIYEIGSIIGPLTIGFGMDWFGDYALFAIVGAITFGGLAVILHQGFYRRVKPVPATQER